MCVRIRAASRREEKLTVRCKFALEKVEISTSNPVLFNLLNKSRILVKLLSRAKEAASTQRTDDCSILDNRFLAVPSRYL